MINVRIYRKIMRIGIVIDYGSFANATSLNLIAKKIFLELGKMMNERKDFTIAALRYENIGIGDINQHYDCICVPNMGGYKFPSKGILTSNNVYIGLIGIDEVILGKKSFRTNIDWERNKPIIEKEVPKWKNGIEKIKFVHVATNSEKQQMIKYLKIPDNKLRIIPLGVDHEQFSSLKEKKTKRSKILGRFLLKDGPYFIHVSESNWARKNVLRVLKAFKVARDEGIKHTLIIIGRVEPIIYEKANKIQGVKVLGFVDDKDLVSLLQNADGMIFPSLHEGFGLPSVEAISCGLPVIASNVFSSPEVLGEGALYVDPYDVNDIAEKIIELSTYEEQRKELSLKAIEQSKKYSWKNTAKQLFELIKANTNVKSDFDFDKSYNSSAHRTVVTISELVIGLPELLRPEVMEFNYKRLISWCVEVGLENPQAGNFLIPFKDWLHSKNEEMV